MNFFTQPTTSAPRIVLLQSADDSYFDLLDVSGRANQAYARRHGYGYRAEVGNLCGVPLRGNWNRYFLIRHEILRREHDWAFWLDADAVVRDSSIPLEPIIEPDREKLVIACRGGHAGEHDINNGVFLFNLRHRLSLDLVKFVMRVGESVKLNGSRFQTDQPAMHRWLRSRCQPDGSIPVLKRYVGDQSDRFNYDGAFVCHVLRQYGTLAQRCEKLREAARWAD